MVVAAVAATAEAAAAAARPPPPVGAAAKGKAAVVVARRTPRRSMTPPASAVGTAASVGKLGGIPAARPRLVGGGSHSSGGSGAKRPRCIPPAPDGRPWPEKYTPTGLASLAVHRRTVGTVTAWLAAALTAVASGAPSAVPRVAVLVGPPGAGKSTLLRLAAAAAEVGVAEWTHPPGGHAASATASLAEFVLARGYPDVTAAPGTAGATTGGSGHRGGYTRRLRIIDDLPYWASTGAEVARLLAAAAADAAGDPLAVVISDRERAAYLRAADLGVPALVAAGRAVRVEVRPVAPGALRRLLRGVAAAEGVDDPGGMVVEAVAAASGGDARAALLALQLQATGGREGERGRPVGAATAAAAPRPPPGLVPGLGRDAPIALLHAVSRVLHNKGAAAAARRDAHPHPSSNPSPLPEDYVLADASIPGAILPFLAANLPAFVASIPDAAAATDALSEATALADSVWTGDAAAAGTADTGTRTTTAVVAALVGVRGVQAALSVRSSSRWRPIRGCPERRHVAAGRAWLAGVRAHLGRGGGGGGLRARALAGELEAEDAAVAAAASAVTTAAMAVDGGGGGGGTGWPILSPPPDAEGGVVDVLGATAPVDNDGDADGADGVDGGWGEDVDSADDDDGGWGLGDDTPAPPPPATTARTVRIVRPPALGEGAT
ncbi:hypothetical protein MMPV_002304 [Pyropia vietnamensis]